MIMSGLMKPSGKATYLTARLSGSGCKGTESGWSSHPLRVILASLWRAVRHSRPWTTNPPLSLPPQPKKTENDNSPKQRYQSKGEWRINSEQDKRTRLTVLG